MAKRVYALLVGINDYGPDIESLDGCLNDVDCCTTTCAATSIPRPSPSRS